MLVADLDGKRLNGRWIGQGQVLSIYFREPGGFRRRLGYGRRHNRGVSENSLSFSQRSPTYPPPTLKVSLLAGRERLSDSLAPFVRPALTDCRHPRYDPAFTTTSKNMGGRSTGTSRAVSVSGATFHVDGS